MATLESLFNILRLEEQISRHKTQSAELYTKLDSLVKSRDVACKQIGVAQSQSERLSVLQALVLHQRKVLAEQQKAVCIVTKNEEYRLFYTFFCWH